MKTNYHIRRLRMKKKSLMATIVFCLIFFFYGCAIAPSRASRVYWAKQYEVLSRTGETLEGTFVYNDLVLYKHPTDGMGTVCGVIFGKVLPPSNMMAEVQATGYKFDKNYYFAVFYQGHKWLFINKLDFKTDGTIIHLTDENPKRDVFSGGGSVYNTENTIFFLTAEHVESLLNTRTLSLQHTGSDVIKFTDEEIHKIKEFIQSDMILKPSVNW